MWKGITPTPDSSFVRALKDFDPKLDIVFDRVAERFIIRRQRAFGKPFGVLLVETEAGEFRQPDQRDIKMLFQADLWRHGGVKERVRKGEEYMTTYQEKEDAKNREEFRAMSRDNKIQLSNTYRKATNTGSKAPEHRRIEVKNSRALTVDQIRDARRRGEDPWAKVA